MNFFGKPLHIFADYNYCRRQSDKTFGETEDSMALLKWDNNYSVNIEVIDNQHKRIIDLLNRMHDAILEHREHQVIEQILQGLVCCIEEEFYQEEELLLLTNFPDIDEHLSSHQILAGEVLSLQERYERGEDITYDVMQFLMTWITQHIMSEDKVYQEYLEEALNPESV